MTAVQKSWLWMTSLWLALALVVGSMAAPVKAAGISGSFHAYKGYVSHLPHGHYHYMYGGHHYWIHHGIFYHSDAFGYKEVKAPIGATIRALPIGYTQWNVRGKTYYSANGNFYRYMPRKGAYKVIARPKGIVGV
ncbi:DUF6515 family protein [Paraferrimonas sedimenticola]|uniref:YHYH protein n=1 Tax=Paraferrimonas sedimenticola TaxID=375674 RepID=A0AA37VYK7_9GAMM|nr:DUF6515 family protein [Paraferrimonas sedimenticola]GLP97076.1 hypothetical protein GCM10007895_23820 [Paraferrimonas sedimenticola]